MALNMIGTPSAAATDLGLGLQQQSAAEIDAIKKKRALDAKNLNLMGAAGQANSAYMSLVGNQF